MRNQKLGIGKTFLSSPRDSCFYRKSPPGAPSPGSARTTRDFRDAEPGLGVPGNEVQEILTPKEIRKTGKKQIHLTADNALYSMESVMSDNQLRAYRDSFRRMIETDASDIIENISSDHAVVIIQELIRAAKQRVCIICHKLSAYVYENKETLDIINEALGRGVAFHIAVKSGTPEAIGCVNLLKSAKQPEIQRVCADSMNVPDFCVVDGKRWRIETHPEKREAKVCANDSVLGEKMFQVFKIVTRNA